MRKGKGILPIKLAMLAFPCAVRPVKAKAAGEKHPLLDSEGRR